MVYIYIYIHNGGFPDGSAVKTSPVVQETWVEFLGREDSLEEEMATHSSILDWKIPWAEESGRLQSKGLQKIRSDGTTKHSTHSGILFSFKKKGNSDMCYNTDKSWELYTKWNKHVTKRHVHKIPLIWIT